MIIAMVAGEASGDQLGAALIRAIRAISPETHFAGIGGPLMKEAGMDCWWDTGELSVMGLFEVISHLPRLVGLRRQLLKRLLSLEPDVFVGIDAPDFNIGLQRKLKAASVRCIKYVSPTVWAWRAGRVAKIARSTDRVMCLFPFEPACYEAAGIGADYTGHPMADEIPLRVETGPARASLGVNPGGPCVALLPGSRMSEVEKLTSPMLEAAGILTAHYPGISFLVPAASDAIRQRLEQQSAHQPDIECRIINGRSKEVMAAADLVICASGTAALEVMLINRPMVVCYRLAGMTYWIAKTFKLVKSRFFSLPNILSSEALVPELLQQEVNGGRIASEARNWLDQPERCAKLSRRFDEIHRLLRKDAADSAARVVLRHAGRDIPPE
jgi:lipid-A-disaccharide synthase